MHKNRYICIVSQQVLSEVVGLRLLGFCFISWISTIHMETIYGFSKTNTWILGSFDFNSVLTKQTSEKVAFFKSGFDNLLEHFLPNTFARKKSKLSMTGAGGCSPSRPPPGSYAYGPSFLHPPPPPPPVQRNNKQRVLSSPVSIVLIKC